jgi:hypothetical protein
MKRNVSPDSWIMARARRALAALEALTAAA